MLKMTVTPLAIKNTSIPHSTPLIAEETISSSTNSPDHVLSMSPLPACGEREIAVQVLLRPFHLAGGRKHRLVGLDLGHHLPAPAGLFLVEHLLLGAIAERGDVHRLEEL